MNLKCYIKKTFKIFMLIMFSPILTDFPENGLSSEYLMETETLENITLNFLPDEILMRIFSFCQVNTMLNTLIHVCQRWKRLAWADITWRKHLTFKFLKSDEIEIEIEIERFKKILSESFNLQSLKIVNLINDESFLFQVAQSCPNLQKLHLTMDNSFYEKYMDNDNDNYDNWDYCCDIYCSDINCNHKDYPLILSPELIKELSQGCSRLMHLNMYCGHYYLDFDFSEFSAFTQLKSLKIHESSIIGFNILGEKCQYLEEVSISDWTEDYEIHFAANLQKTLKVLKIQGSSSLTDISMETLSGCTSLEKLSLNFCGKITNQGLSQLHRLTKLKSLIIDCCFKVSHKGITNLFRRPHFEKLIHLTLEGIQELKFADIKNLPNVLPELKVLGIIRCREIKNDELLHGFKHRIPNLIINTNKHLVKTLMMKCFSELRH